MTYREVDLSERMKQLEERVAKLEAPLSLDHALDAILDAADRYEINHYYSSMQQTSDPAFINVYNNNIRRLVEKIRTREKSR